MTKQLPALATRAAVVATTTAAAAILATLPTVTSATANHLGTGSVAAPAQSGTVAPGTTGPAQVSVAVEPVAQRSAVQSGASASALALAMGKRGSPYVWGGSGPNAFDCSGLVQWAYQQAGVDLPRTTGAQSQVGTPVAQSDLRPGDLVFFYSPVSHVGIYAGDGEVVHSSRPGQPVSTADVDNMPFHSARRV